MIKKKIFITIPWFLPAYRAGGPVRSVVNLVENFKDAEFYIFTGDMDVSGIQMENVQVDTWVMWNGQTKVWYASKGHRFRELTAQVNQINPDTIFSIGIYSWYFTLVPMIFCRAGRKIISARGMLHPAALEQKRVKKKIFIHLLRAFKFNKRYIFHATDNEEEGYIKSNFGNSTKIIVAGNFPTLVGYQPIIKKRKGSLQLITIALISPMKNIIHVLRQLKNVTESIEYKIFGAVKDEEYWEKCKQAINELPANVTVDYMGPVRHDEINERLKECHVSLLPSKSENFGHAIYESLSSGRPVITSVTTPFKDLQSARAGINLNPEEGSEIVHAIEFFAEMDEEELQRWSSSAFAYASSFFDKAALVKAYSRLFDI